MVIFPFSAGLGSGVQTAKTSLCFEMIPRQIAYDYNAGTSMWQFIQEVDG